MSPAGIPRNVADQGAAERHAVPGRAPVVRQDHRVAGIDEGLRLRVVAVAFVPLGAAVDRHHRREGALALGGRDERVDPLARRIVEPERAVGPSARSIGVGGKDLLARVGFDPRWPRGIARLEPHRAVRAYASAAVLFDIGMGVRDRVERRRSRIEAVQLRATLELVTHQERRGVGPPLDGEDAARQIHGDVAALAGDEVPDRGSLEGSPLAGERQPLVARDRRPRVGH
jgi:hypothetical protein